MYAHSIAYVECGSAANAAAIKEWFDNKYVDFVLLMTVLNYVPK